MGDYKSMDDIVGDCGGVVWAGQWWRGPGGWCGLGQMAPMGSCSDGFCEKLRVKPKD